MRNCSILVVLGLLAAPVMIRAQTLAGSGGALAFNGGYVQIASNASLTVGSQVTFEAWVNPSTAASSATIISRGDGSNGSITDYIVQLQRSGNGFVLAFFGAGQWDYSTGIIPSNAWTHVAFTYDGATKQFFTNGVSAGTAPRSGSLYFSGSPIYIGRQGSSCNCNYFSGMIDEVRVWNTVRAGSQINQNFKQTLAGTEAGLVAYYRFDYVFGILARDSSTNRNNGMLVNRPVPVPSTVPFPLYLALNNSNPFTNSCKVPFVDPGAAVSAAPFAIAGSDGYSFALKPDGTPLVWLENNISAGATPVFGTNLIAFSYSDSGSGLGLRADGSVLAWGDNHNGQTNVPPSATNVVAISQSPGGFNLALKGNGALVGWGNNDNSETNIPPNATNVVAIAVGSFQALAVKGDGTVVAWGANVNGVTNVPPNATNAVAVAADNNGYSSIALRADGSLVVWGDNSYGQTNVPPNATNVVSVAANSRTIVAARADGTVVSWGYGLDGQTNIPPQATNIVSVAASAYASLLQSGYGTLLVGTTDPFSENLPTNIYALGVPVSSSGIVDTSTLGSYLVTYLATNALNVTGTTNRTVVVADIAPPGITLLGNNPLTWNFGVPFVDPGATAFDRCDGNETAGIVATGTVNVNVPGLYRRTYMATDPAGNSRTMVRNVMVQPSPAVVLAGINPVPLECHGGLFTDPGAVVIGTVQAIGAGGENGFVITATGGLRVSGNNTYSQDTPPSNATNGLIQVAFGETCGIALLTNGNLVAWGSGPTNVPPNATNIISVAAGDSSALAARADGTVIGWGSDSYGQLDAPPGLTNVMMVAEGYAFSVALKNDGTVVAWGDDSVGEIDVPANTTNVVAISVDAEGSDTLALRSDGSVIGWGFNLAGLGVPSGATNVVAVAAGENHFMALKADGSILVWGDNSVGQTNIPVNVTNVVAIAAGDFSCHALMADGSTQSWGDMFVVNSRLANRLPFTVVTNGTFDINTVGTYLVTYTSTNITGMSLTNTRTINVADDLPPNLTLFGNNPVQLVAGMPFADPGATAIDQCAGDLTSSVVVTGSVNNNVPGSYNLTYTVTDPHGNAATNNRSVVVVAAPSLGGVAASYVATNADTAIIAAQLGAMVNPNGLPTTAYIQFGLNTSYSAPMPLTTNFPAVYTAGTISAVVGNLSRAVVYHWRVVGSNSVGVTASPDQLLPVPGLYAAGDFNGDGIVSPGELSGVLSNYFATSPWLYLTNVAGLGQSNVTFQLTNSLEGAFSVQVSTNLNDWQPLGSAIPFYKFTDTNAPGAPTRYYRLQWP